VPGEKIPQIQLEQVSLSTALGLHYLLRNVSFEVFPGERVGLIGPSGSGKTSLLRLLNRLSELTTGAIYLQGQEIRQINVLTLRQQVMLVPQEPKLLGMTVQAALAYPLVLRGVSQSIIQQRLQHWMQQLGMTDDWLQRGELQLSVGQRQLVSIGRALMTEPQILLLDEPTSALDLGRIEQLMQVLVKSEQTLIIATHQLELVQRFCDRLLWLEEGELVQNLEVAGVDWDKLRETFKRQEQATASEWN
jgi:D-methionine transport system ATP-binding protein